MAGEWKFATGGIIVDAQAWTVFFLEDSYTCDLSNVELDESGQRPGYRFKKNVGTLASTTIPMAILPVCQAFDDFRAWVLPTGKVFQSREAFQPHNRGFKLSLDQADFYKKYVSLVGKDSSRSFLQEI